MEIAGAYELVAWGCASFDALVVAAVLHRQMTRVRIFQAARLNDCRRKWNVAAIISGVFAGLICFGSKAIVLNLIGVNWFGIARLLYYDIALVPAVMGAVLAWGVLIVARREPRNVEDPASNATGRTEARVRQPAAGMIPVILGLAPAGICAYASWIEPYRVVLERPEVRLERAIAGDLPLRIGILADIQTDRVTPHEKAGVRRVVAESPDLLLLPGDYFQVLGSTWRQNWKEHELWPEFRDFAGELTCAGTTLAVLGDVDRAQRTRDLFEGSRVRLLVNEIALVEVRGIRIAVAGVELDYKSAEARQAIGQLSETPAELRLVLAHRPDVALLLRPADRVDLVIAGHTHGGQVVIPGFGPPITLSNVPRRVAAGGLHWIGEQRIYVSRGLGFERGLAPPMRLFCRPEVTLMTVR